MTAELPADLAAWADDLRRAHYPAHRNRLRAHVTLFHALPPSVEAELRALLAEHVNAPPPQARLSGVMKLGGGTALAIESPAMGELREAIARRMAGALTPQDSQPARLHITIQNKVTLEAARALQAELGSQLLFDRFRFRGLALHAYEGGPWRTIRTFMFRGN